MMRICPTVSITFVCGLLALAGCGTGDGGIRSYDVDKRAVATDESPEPPAAAAAKQRMLAAMVPSGSQMWFVKLTGDEESVGKVATSFDTLVKSLEAIGETIKWTLPEDWSEQPGNEFRYATLIAPADDKRLEVSISKLPYQGNSDEDFAAYVKDNVNRWRGQMGLPAEESREVSDHAKLIGDATSPILMVDLTGSGSGQMAMPPFANMPKPPAQPAATLPPVQPQVAAQPPASEPFTSALPDGWSRAQTRPMTMAIFATKQPGAEVAVTQFPAAGKMSDKLWNINRWRDQVGLADITADEVDDSMTDIEIDGKPAKLIVLFPEAEAPAEADGPAEQKPKIGIAVAMLDQNEVIWFFKLNGEASAVKAEQPTFEEWLATIKFKPQTAE